jgi:CheY-like chemotaxis protein
MTQVLVADPHDASRQSISTALADAGFHVLEAADGVGVLHSLMEHTQPLVVLLDEPLPELDAAALLRLMSLKPEARDRYAVVLLTSDLGAVISKSMSGKLGKLPIYVVAKPLQLDSLATVIRLAERHLPALATRHSLEG